MTRTPLLIAIPLPPIELYIRTGTTPSDDHRIQFSPGLGYTLLRGSDVDSVDALPVSVEGTTAFLSFQATGSRYSQKSWRGARRREQKSWRSAPPETEPPQISLTTADRAP